MCAKYPPDVFCPGPDLSTHQTNYHENSPHLLSHGHCLRGQHGHCYGSKYDTNTRFPWIIRLFIVSAIAVGHCDTHSHTLMYCLLPANGWHRLHPPQLYSRVPGQRSSQSQGSDDDFMVFLSLHSFIPSPML